MADVLRGIWISLMMALMLVCSPADSHQKVLPLRLRLARDGDLLGWLVAGPFPNVGANKGLGTGFGTDYLNGEATANPTEDQLIGGCSWRFAMGDVAHGLDLKAHFRTNDPGIAYCFTNLEAS